MVFPIKRYCRVRNSALRTFTRKGLDRRSAESDISYLANLNDVAPTFTRATSSYDPIANRICQAGERRRRRVLLSPTQDVMLDLIEGSRTNLLAAGFSEHFERWTATDTTAVFGSTAPDGTATACLCTEGTAGTASLIGGITITAGATVSFSVYAKVSTVVTWYRLQVGTGADAFRAFFNISTGVKGSTLVAGTSTVSGSTLTDIGGGVYRLTVTGVVNAGSTAVNCSLRSATADLNSTPVNNAAYIAYGALAEQAAFPSSYISNRNLLLQTETLNTTWTKTDITVTSDSTANPIDGSVTADTITEGSAGTAILSQTATIVANQTIVYSTYLKRGNTDWVQVKLLSGGADGCRVWVNLNTGAIGTTAVIGAGTYTSSSITAVGSFYRIQLVGKVGAASTAPVASVNSANADNSGARVNGATWIAYGMQLEYGTAATPYWANSTAVGLRAADALTSTIALSTTAGTLLALLIPSGWTGDQDGSATWEVMRDNDTTNDLGWFRVGATTIGLRRADGAGNNQTGNITHGLTNGVLTHLAGVYDSASHRGFLNGVASGTVSSPAPTPPFNAVAVIKIGAGTSANREFYGWVGVPYWDRALTANELLRIKLANPVAA